MFAVSLVASGEVFHLSLLIFYVRQDVLWVFSSWPGSLMSRQTETSSTQAGGPNLYDREGSQPLVRVLCSCRHVRMTPLGNAICLSHAFEGQSRTQPVFMFPVFPCNLSLSPWICWALVDAEDLQLTRAGWGYLPSVSSSRPVPSLSQPPWVRNTWWEAISLLSQASDELKMA